MTSAKPRFVPLGRSVAGFSGALQAAGARAGGRAAPRRVARAVTLAGWALAALTFGAVEARTQLFEVTVEQEVALGRAAAAEIERDLELIDDAEVVGYLGRLGEALASQAGRSDVSYQFKVVNAPEINAFALPGGLVYVNRGLIEAATDESELAGVLGHEIGHVAARHGVAQMQQAQVANIGLSVLDSIIGSGTRGRVARVAADMVASGAFMKFSRDDEREADRIAAETMVAAGHDPRALMTFFEKLAALGRREPNAVQRFFESHPSPDERIDNVGALAERLADDVEATRDSTVLRAIQARLSMIPTPAAARAVASSGAVEPVALPEPRSPYPGEARDAEIASLFAPVFYQALGSEPRFDLITRFDFDGDWQGDNNWRNAADARHSLAAYVYYAVAETTTHFFVHYAVFHPRDYKGGAIRGVILSEIIREGARRRGEYDPTGLSRDAVLAHENDLEGCLVVAEKRGPDPHAARLVLVETLAHNEFLKYRVTGSRRPRERISTEGQRARLFIEPRGHGIEAYRGSRDQRRAAERGTITYRSAGRAEVPRASGSQQVGYALVPLHATLWARAAAGVSQTFGEAADYGVRRFAAAAAAGPAPRAVAIGTVGSAFRGTVGGDHLARPPWAWFDSRERDRPAGEWFFTPAETIKRHFDLDDAFSTTYVHLPFVGIYRD